MRSTLDRKLRSVRWRRGLDVLLRQAAAALVIAGVVAMLAVLAQRLLGVTIVTLYSAVGLGVAAAVLTGVFWVLRRPGRMDTALLIDKRLRLHERFSSTLAFADREDPFARAAVSESHRVAESVNVKGGFPIRLTKRWAHAGGVWVVAVGLLLFLPQMDLLDYLKTDREQQEQAAKLAQAKADVQQAVSSVKTAVKQLGDPALADELAELGDLVKGAAPGEMKRQAIRKLGDLSERIKELQAKKRLKSTETLKDQFSRLRPSPKGGDNELNRALARGEFSKAAAMMRDLRKRLAEGKVSEKEKSETAEQLRDTARQLAEMAQKKKALQRALQDAGLDKELAKLDQDKLREALEKKGLTDKEIKELMEKASECEETSSQCDRLSKAMLDCLDDVDMLDKGGLVGLGEKLSELEAAMQDLKLTKATLDEIQRGIASLGEGMEGMDLSELEGQGGFREGLAQKQGQGSGGPGRGYGARETAEKGDAGYVGTRVKGKTQAGPVIAEGYFRGPQVKGEAKREYGEVVRAARERAAAAVSENRVPRKYEGPVKKYFGGLDELGKDKKK